MSRFLKSYGEFFRSITDASDDFCEASGLACLMGISLGSRWIERGIGKLRPNLYIVLTAESSRDRKSTSVRLATDLLRAAAPEVIGPDDFVAEPLMRFIGRKNKETEETENNNLLLPIEEFGDYLARAARSYGSTLSATLCKMYDGASTRQLRAGTGLVETDEQCVGILAGAAYAMIEKYADPKDWETGLFARINFIIPRVRRPRFPIPPIEPAGKRVQLVRALYDLRMHLASEPGVMHIDQAAEEMLLQHVAKEPKIDDHALIAQQERLRDSILKFAILYQIDENPSVPIGVEAMTKALAFADTSRSGFAFVYGRASGTTQNRLVRKIWRKIDEAKSISRRDLYKKIHSNLDEVTPILNLLLQAGVIESTKQGKSIAYKIVEPYVGADSDAD